MTSLAAATHFIRELRSRGCRSALDDFGSGLSSFIFLKNLPVDFLKIDGQFMHNVTHDHIDRSMVEAIAQIGETMGILTDRRASRLGRGACPPGRHRHPVRAGQLHRRAPARRDAGCAAEGGSGQFRLPACRSGTVHDSVAGRPFL